MEIREWASMYQVKCSRDVCGDPVVPGRAYHIECCHVYEDGNRLGICLLFDHGKTWKTAKRKALAAGFTLKQDGDREGTLLFDADNESQSRLALKLCGIYARRRLNISQADRIRRSVQMKQVRSAMGV